MFLDVPTLFIVSSCIAALLGLFLFFAWVQDRNIRALAWWGAAYMLGGLGMALWIVEAALVSEPLSCGLSNALLFAACGTIWNGARLFYGREVRPLALSAGAIAWIAACQIPDFAQSDLYRIVLSCLIVSVYTFATAREIWTDRRKRTRSRWAAICVPVLHGLVFLPPIPLAVARTGETTLLSSGWIAVFTLETLLYVVGTAFIALMMAKERTESLYKLAAATDPLTGLLNRRGFMELAQLLTARRARKDGRVSVLMFDLDHFKGINDRFGHAVGDAALRCFADSIQATMRDGDVIGRLGGEEFAAIVLGSANDAAIAAERVRAAFEAAGAVIAGRHIGATVSIGVADGLARACSIEQLLSRADAALYAAKQAGRNRVVCAAEEVRPSAVQPAGAAVAPAGIPCAA
ncbi:MAG TPA: GGDEF domain-containing protein [Xanthobacteraceae bacterium]|nr:GGDEF domain-containing protein [Xanthobacteraceae bacterium]